MQTQTSVTLPIEWSSLIPKRTDRIVLVGQTGSGKTTLARWLLANNIIPRPYRVVVDYKGMLDWPEYKAHRSLKTLTKDRSPLLLYRPNFEESVSTECRAQLWEWLYRRGNTTIYVDETMSITSGDIYPMYYGGCLTRGRELGIELWSATQRPIRIPQVVLSESENVYAFRLRLPQDRERVEALTSINRRDIAELSKQQFLYARQDGDVIGPIHLKLS